MVEGREIAGPEDMAEPRLARYKDSVMAVGGQDPNSRKCLVYDMITRKWTEAGQMVEGRSEPGLVTAGSKMFAVGGRGFYWHARVDSMEVLDWGKGDSWRTVDSPG